jgi:hypothetical protein
MPSKLPEKSCLKDSVAAVPEMAAAEACPLSEKLVK